MKGWVWVRLLNCASSCVVFVYLILFSEVNQNKCYVIEQHF